MFAFPVLLVASAVSAAVTPLAAQDGEALRLITRDPSVPTAVVLKRGKEATHRHPADYFVHLLVAERLASERHPATMRWLNRAIFLHPTYGPAHLMAAELLAVSGRKAQALIEYRFAADNTVAPHEVWDKAARRYPALEDLLKATPPRVGKLTRLGRWLDRNLRTDESDKVHLLVLQEQPNNAEARRGLVNAALAQRNFKVARRRLASLMRVDQSEDAWEITARERLMVGDPDAAMKIIDTRLTRHSLKFNLELALASLLSGHARHQDARERLARLQQDRKLTREQVARIHDVSATIERQAGNEHQFRWEVEQARRLREQ